MKSIINKTISLIELPRRVLGPNFRRNFTNIEKYKDFDFKLNRISRTKGVSCMLRVKNEEDKILACLNSVCDVFDEVIFVDNGSTDNTVAIVKDFVEKNKDKAINIYQYPHNVSRCGDENANTPQNSVSSLAYYYNWCLSKCHYAYVCKWDADMLLHPCDKRKFKQVLSNLTSLWPVFIEIEVQTIYLKDKLIFSVTNDINNEIRIFPNRSDVFFEKDKLLEVLKARFYKVVKTKFLDMRVYEIKNTAIDEFSHWSSKEFLTERKKVEWENYNMINSCDDIISENIKIIDDKELESAIVGGKND
ncbi:glycosyltransferase [Vibrio ziniensis]|uniref:Glycosyltransferase n=1 Tax=Vibrio ziniensis TaxID=2711221 RepID=A0A6G7CMK6_9VIBR|nr:glycosyltransferase [Vibrio ziniensis]QIH43300.1 glycosyltransferase [Vibrio ziniensis]